VKNEIFVIQLLGSSARARAVAAPVLGDMAQVDLLRALRNPRPVRPAGSTTIEALFDDLATRMRREFSPPGPPDRVTVEHLRALAHPEIQREVARGLGYRPEALLPTVFDADRLGHTLETIGSGTDDSGDAEALFLRLLERLPLIDVQFGLGSGNWTHFIEQQRWITATAAEKLRTVAGNDHLGQDVPTPQVLAYLIERAGRPPAGQAEVYFDAFALIELRRRLAFLGEQLRDEAMDRAELAAQIAPDLRAVSYLPAWLELYEFGSIASGMLTLFTGAISFAELLPPDLHDPPTAVTSEPVSSEGLLVKNEVTYGRFQHRETFDIACMVHGEEEPQTILRCKGLSKNQSAQVKDVVQRLTGGDLSITGDSVGARLLNTRVPVQEGLAGHLRAALHRYGAEAVQCAILTGLQQPVTVPTPWHDQLNAGIPYQGLYTAEDAWMPSCNEVTNELTSSVQDSPHGEIPLKILMPGSGGAPYLDKDSPGPQESGFSA
jgi:hypothetical protein